MISQDVNFRNSHYSNRSLRTSHQTLLAHQIKPKLPGIQVVDEDTDYIPYKVYITPYQRETRIVKERDYSPASQYNS